MQKFYNIHNSVPFITFSPAWKTVTGELVPLVERQQYSIRPGEIYASADESDRKFLIKGTNAGNIVITECFAPHKGPMLFKCFLPYMFNLKIATKPNFPIREKDYLNETTLNYLLEKI